jgi:hypothetical protein
MLTIDYKILNDILIIPHSKVPKFVLNLFKFKITRILIVALLFLKGKSYPNTSILISIWYILILGQIGKQNFYETFADDVEGTDALEDDDAKKKIEERNAERIKLEKNLNLAKLAAKYSRKNLEVAEKFAEETTSNNIKMGELLDEINDKLEVAKDEAMIKTLEIIQKSISKMETLSNGNTDAATEKVNDFKNTVNDSDNKVKEVEKELENFLNEEQYEEETRVITYEKAKEKAKEKLNEARMAKKLEEVALDYYHKEKIKVNQYIKDIKDVNRQIIKETENREVVKILKKIRYKKIEIRNNSIKLREEAKTQWDTLKQNTNNLFEMAKLEFVELKKYDIKGDTSPNININKELIINNYKINILNNLKTKECLNTSNKYFTTLENKITSYSTSKSKLYIQIAEARKTKNNILVSTLEKMQDNITETEEVIKKELTSYNIERNRIKDKDLTEVNNIKNIIDDYKHKFKSSIESEVTLVDEVNELETQNDTNHIIPTQIYL